MAPQYPRTLRRITPKSPAELSQYKRLSRSPRKLATAKCDNCRQGKSKCVPQGNGCRGCSQKGLDCPGLTKRKRTQSRSPTLADPLPSATGMTPPVAGTTLEPPQSVSNELLVPGKAFNLQPGYPWCSIWGAAIPSDLYRSPWMFIPEDIYEISARQPYALDTDSEESDALDELEGLEIGLDFLDESEDEDESIDHDEKTIDDDEKAATDIGEILAFLVVISSAFRTGDSAFTSSSRDTFISLFYEDENKVFPYKNIRHASDVNAYLARHKREIEQLIAEAQARQQECDSMSNEAKEMEKARCNWALQCESSIRGRLPKMSQFNVLRDLNSVLRSRYQEFCQLATESSWLGLSYFAHELREKCPKPRDLRRLGTRMFKKVIQGTSPTTLLEIFAFISLSQAMTTVMRHRDVQIDLDPGTIDYLSWRTCIEDEASRGVYDEILMAWFHPQWKVDYLSGESKQSPLSVQEAMQRLVHQLMKAKETDEAFRFSAFRRLDPSLQKRTAQESTCTSRDDDCEPSGSPVDTSPEKEEKDDPGGSGTEALINTAIFVGVWLFMIYISALGVALVWLGNPEQRRHLITGNGEEHVASALNVVLVVEKMKEKILDRLRQHPRSTALEGIFKAMEEVLDGGYIWSVSDLHICLEKAVQNHVEEPGLRSQLYTDIRHWCKEASNLVEPICERHRGGCMFVPVAA